MSLKSSTHFALAALLASGLSASMAAVPNFLTAKQKAEDFTGFCQFVQNEYAYFDLKKTDWSRVCANFAAQTAAVKDRKSFVALLERALGELYDAHAHLGTNTDHSYRLVPSQTDLRAVWDGGHALLTHVRSGSNAERAGLRAGMEVLALDSVPIGSVVDALAPQFLSQADPAARHWALQVALAGRHEQTRIRLTVQQGGKRQQLTYSPDFPQPTAPLSARVIDGVGYVRIHNALGDSTLVAAFDAALATMTEARALVIDLRGTPSGGTSSVARGIMGRLVSQTQPYQRHELVSEFRESGIRRVWVEYVAPRGSPFLVPVVLLVGPWTGSMGEGLAIGLNAARGAPVVGQPMAHLLGALGETVLPHSKIAVRVPTEKLFHFDGSPREAFVPCPAESATPAAVAASGYADAELRFALELALKLSQGKTGACAP